MRILVLGAGQQGQAVVYDLARSEAVESVTCADADSRALERCLANLDSGKVKAVRLDAGDPGAVRKLMGDGFDVAVDMLPITFIRGLGQAAVDTRTHLVNTYYDHDLRDLAEPIRQVGITVLPEMGLDPGIDLVLAGSAVREFEKVTALYSYGGGIPEPAAIDNPLKYKISWTWAGVLNSYDRDARMIEDGQAVDVPSAETFQPQYVHRVDVAPLGALEAFPNGDAVRYVERLGLAETIRTAGRYSLRWPGHAQTWRVFKELGFLQNQPVDGLPGGVSPRQFMIRHLAPRLQYGPRERDIAVLLIILEGVRQSRPVRRTMRIVDYRDGETGLMAMARTVGFPASIAAQMIADGTIQERGLLSPLTDVPAGAFRAELARRGIEVHEEETSL